MECRTTKSFGINKFISLYIYLPTNEIGLDFRDLVFAAFHSCFGHAVAIVALDRKTSTSYFQRKLSIGYNRAADLMECEGMTSAAGSGGKREIFLPEEEAF